MTMNLADIVRPSEGLISCRIFADPEIHSSEMEHIFGRSWFFIGHESEIPNPGDMVSRFCGVDPAILVRGDDGKVRVFLNSCRHRGMRICRTDRDNARVMRCPYHGWTYRNNGELLAVGAESHYGEGELDKHELGLIPVAHLGNYRGLIFATWDENAEPFEDWLGDMRWYMDIIFGRTGEIEILGAPQVWEAECSWKVPADNFTDNFHLFWTHRSLVQVGMLPNHPDFAANGHMISAGNGHTLHFVKGPPGEEALQGLGVPKVLWPEFDKNLNPDQVAVARDHSVSAGTIWPNFHWLQLATAGDKESPPVGFLNLRLEMPLSPTRTRMFSWFAIDKKASPEYRRASYETYVHTFGPGGVFDQDDMENWEDCTAMTKGPAAKKNYLHHKMGLGRTACTEWRGPGLAHADGYDEVTQRAWYEEWLKQIIRKKQ